MGVSYKKLFKLLIDRNMKKKDLQQLAGLSPAWDSGFSGCRRCICPSLR